jgi:hypothetical protein
MKIMQMPAVPNGPAAIVAGILRAMGATGSFGGGADFAKQIRMPEQVPDQLNKAAVSPTTPPITTSQGKAFLAASAPFGLFDRVVNDSAGRELPLDTAVAVEVGGLIADARGIGQPIALGKLQLSNGILVRRETAIMIAITKQMLRAIGGQGEATLSLIARAAIAQATDKVVFGLLTSSSTPSATASTLEEAVSAALLGLGGLTSTSRIYLALSPQAALLGSATMGENGLKFPGLTPNGGQIGSMPAVATAGLEGSEVVAIDADGLALNGGELQVDVSGQADFQPSDAPAAGPQQMVSSWQTNTSLLRLIRQFGIEPLRVDAISRVTITGN